MPVYNLFTMESARSSAPYLVLRSELARLRGHGKRSKSSRAEKVTSAQPNSESSTTRKHQKHAVSSHAVESDGNLTHILLSNPKQSIGTGESAGHSNQNRDASMDLPDTQDAACYTDEDLYYVDKNLAFGLPQSERVEEIRLAAVQSMTSMAEATLVCCVCELDCEEAEIDCVLLSEQLLVKMSLCLKVPEDADIPRFIIEQYDASAIDQRLHGLLLFPGAIRAENGGIVLQICHSCQEQIAHQRLGLPPVLSIANSNYIGHLPEEFTSISRTDEQAVALVSPCVSLSTVTGGPCRTIKSHHYVVENTGGPIIGMLPEDLTSKVRVTMVGNMTPKQIAKCKTRYKLNVRLCRELLAFLYNNNREYKLYRSTRREMLASVRPTSVIIDKSNSTGDDTENDAIANEVRDNSTYATFGSRMDEEADASVETSWISASSLIMHQQQHWTDLLVRKSNSYVSMVRWGACVHMFPSLLPGGCGGPAEARKRPMSVRKWIRRCLNIHEHRFEKHYAFLLLAFDYLASKNARETMFLKMHVSAQALEAGNISETTVRAAIDYYNYLIETQARGLKPISPPQEVQHVIDLRKGLRTPETAFYGSNLSRMRARHELFAILKRFGTMQVFFTISPDTSGTYSIAIKVGEVSVSAVDNANLLLLPDRTERRSIAANHPVQCAKYFMHVMETVVSSVLGWDKEQHRPTRGGGLFGIVRAFGAAAETQIAGDLHAHFAVWLHGFPATTRELWTALQYRDDFRERLLELVNSVLTTKPPCMGAENVCPNCNTATLLPIVPGIDAFRRPTPGGNAPETSHCGICGRIYRDKDIIDAAIEALANYNGVQIVPKLADFYKCRPGNANADDTVPCQLIVSILVRDVQVHFWSHSKSCFKVTVRTPKGTVCRFFKPEQTEFGPTYIDNLFKVCLHRPVGCEYVNPFNETILGVFKCNHDVQFILNRDAKDAAGYVCKYCIKKQIPIENPVALSLAAFTKASAKAKTLPPDISKLDRGYKILNSMLYATTNGQEVAATMAALYVERESPFWFSHDFVKIDLEKSIHFNDRVTEEIIIASESSKKKEGTYIRAQNALRKYWRRQPALEDVSFITICEQYEETASGQSQRARFGSLDNTDPVTILYFEKTVARKIFVMCGKQMPDISRYNDKDSMNFYYSALLTLFKPHRQTTLLQQNQSPLRAYREFLSSGHSAHISALEEFEAMWHEFFRAESSDVNVRESAEDELLRTRRRPTSFWNGVNGTDDSKINAEDSEDDEIPDGVLQVAAMEIDETTSSRNLQFIISEVPNLQRVIDVTTSAYSTTKPFLVDPTFSMDTYIARIREPETNSSDESTMGTHFFIRAFPDARTRLERLAECFQPVPWICRDDIEQCTPEAIPSFPKIQEVSQAFRLNFWQHVNFEVAARHLLYAYSKDIEAAIDEPIFSALRTQEPYEIKSQFRAYLGGEAGTGKSTVVNALLTFANKWGREGSVETMAFTGVASINIHGRTMHSSRNLKLNGAEPNNPPTLEMKSKFRRVILVIIDEISMTDQALLGGTDAVSRGMSSKPTECMGAKHFMLIGDLLQLPPIGGSPCFAAPPAGANRLRHAGFAVYSRFNFVVFLTENMRALSDPVYTALLADLRWGRLSEQQLSALNARVLSSSTCLQEASHPSANGFYKPLVVSTNKLRCAINEQTTYCTASRLGVPVYECVAEPSHRSEVIFSNIVNANDDLTDRVPLRLLFYIGMPIMLTRKHPELLNANIIANGIMATIVGFYPPPHKCMYDSTSVNGVTLKRFVGLPSLLFVKIFNCSRTLIDGFPPATIGIPPLRAKLRLAKFPNLSQATITVRQFALVPAFACTTEKLQGQTCHHGVTLTPLDRRPGVPPQTLYVALSRSINLHNVVLTEPITHQYLAKFVPTQVIANEMRRLIDLVRLPSYISPIQIADFNNWKAHQCISN